MAAIDVDSPGQHAAMVEKLNLPFPMLSDPDRTLAVEPYDLVNLDDPRGLAIPATVLIGPNGEELLRIVSRDYADRCPEDDALGVLRDLALPPVEQQAPSRGKPEPGPRAMPFGDLRTYFRGAKFGAMAMGLRSGDTDEADRFGVLMDRYSNDITTMYRNNRDSGERPQP